MTLLKKISKSKSIGWYLSSLICYISGIVINFNESIPYTKLEEYDRRIIMFHDKFRLSALCNTLRWKNMFVCTWERFWVNSLSVIPLMPNNTNVSLFSLHFNGPGRGYLAWIYRCCTVNNFMKPPNNKNFPCVSSVFDGCRWTCIYDVFLKRRLSLFWLVNKLTFHKLSPPPSK